MAEKSADFAHRHNPNGSWDSICPRCHLTIASSENEADLQAVEQSHDCDEFAMKRYLDWKLGWNGSATHS